MPDLRILVLLSTLPLLLAACESVDALPDGVALDDAVPLAESHGAWENLLRPVALAADPEGRIYVGDQGDRAVKVFHPDGGFRDRFGGFGSGPGEVVAIQRLAVLEEEVIVADPQSGRLVRFDRTGEFLGIIPNESNADQFGTLGADGIVLAGSPQWALNAALEPSSTTLFEVIGPDGGLRHAGGPRTAPPNPFTGHIVDFVLPAGARDGSFLWLAYLNHPDVLRYELPGGDAHTVERTLPFEWQQLTDDFEPSSELLAEGRDASPPFDVVTLDIATDRHDRAFVLTALGPTRAGEPSVPVVGVDVLDPESGWTHRIRLPETASAIAVSPDGDRLYLLDESTGRIHVYAWGNDA